MQTSLLSSLEIRCGPMLTMTSAIGPVQGRGARSGKPGSGISSWLEPPNSSLIQLHVLDHPWGCHEKAPRAFLISIC
jgi:hypothetical protein